MPLATIHVYEVGLTTEMTVEQRDELVALLGRFAVDAGRYHTACFYGKTREYDVDDLSYESVFPGGEN